MSKFDEFNELKYKGYVGHYTKMIKEAFEAGQKAGPEWIPVSVRLPIDCRNVYIRGINDCGMDRTAKAMYCRKFELEASEGTDEEWCDENPETGDFFVPEGWYENNTSSEIDYAIDFKVTDWQPLPEIK